MDPFLYLLGVFLILYLLVAPAVAFLRTLRIGELVERIARLEGEVRRLRRAPRPAPAPAEEETRDALPVEAAPPAPRFEPRPVLSPAPEPEPPPQGPGPDLETWLGQRALGWTAVALLLFAAGFFLKYAFDNNWVGPQGQLTVCLAAGLGLCVAGLRRFRRPPAVGRQMLLAAGVVLLYLTTYAAFGYYRLISTATGGVFLTALVIEVVLLALLCDSPALALMAVVGGLVNPLLLHADVDRHDSLFLYLLLLKAASAALTLRRPWHLLATLALVGTHGLFWAWYDVWYHPEKRAAALGFQAALAALHVGQGLLALLLPRPALHPEDNPVDGEGLVRQALVPLLLAIVGYALLVDDHRPALGSLALAVAVVYAALAAAVQGRQGATPLLLVWVATALGLAAAAVALEARGGWIAVGWAAEGAALWYFGLRLRADALRALALALLALAVGRLLIVERPAPAAARAWLLLNGYALPGLAVAACLGLAAEASRRVLRPAEGEERALQAALGLGAVVLAWLVLTVEVYDFFARRGIGDTLLAGASVSGLWAAYATLVVGVGLRLRSQPLRWTGLVLLGLALGKVVLFDTGGLPGLYRVATFLALAVLMGLAAWAYQRFHEGPPEGPGSREGAGRDTISI